MTSEQLRMAVRLHDSEFATWTKAEDAVIAIIELCNRCSHQNRRAISQHLLRCRTAIVEGRVLSREVQGLLHEGIEEE